MLLSSLLSFLTDPNIRHLGENLPISGVTCDSREVKPGFIFVAIPGALTDGHLYIESAIEKGASAIVAEKYVEIDIGGISYVTVPFARQALAELSRAYFGFADRDMYMIGITATNGKTTTTSMLRHILEAEKVPTSVIGSVAYSFGDEKTASVLTTPESSELHAMLKKQREAGIKVVSMEVSSIAEEQCRVYGIRYDAVAFLNITPDHLPDHGSFEAYYEAKAMLVKNVAEGVPVILNLDDPRVAQLQNETKGQVIGIGIDHGTALISAENLTMPGGIPQFDLVIRSPLRTGRGELPPGRWPVKLSIPGRHTVYNAMAALTIAMAYGIAPERAVKLIESVPGIERRLQILYQKEFTIIDDHISDEDNTRKMMEALVQMTEGAPVKIIYAIRGNRGVEVNREVIGQFQAFRDKINWSTFYLTSSRDLAKPRDVVRDEEYDTVTSDLEHAGYNFTYIPNLVDAIEQMLPTVLPGEFFVLAGSHNMDKGARIALNLLAEGREASERESILKVLENRMMG